MKKYKLRRSFVITSIIILLIIIVLIILLVINNKESYSLEYSYNDFKISENYDKNKKEYYFEIYYNKIKYAFISNSKKTNKTKLINKIEEYKDEDYICLKTYSKYIENNILCSYKDQQIDSHLVSNNLLDELIINKNKEESKYEIDNYTIYNNDNIYIWNYKGFINISSSKYETIKIFNNDIYETKLIGNINNYILIPDYESEINFNKIYLLDTNKNKITIWDLEYDISFDSIILGTHDKSIFILDKSQKKEYELVPHKKKMRIVGTNNNKGVIYNKDSLKNVSLENIITNNLIFTYDNSYNYYLKDNNIYLDYYNYNNKIKISNYSINKILAIEKDTVYYLVNTKLYKYNPSIGELLIAEYSDWEYNSLNMIFPNNQK